MPSKSYNQLHQLRDKWSDPMFNYQCVWTVSLELETLRELSHFPQHLLINTKFIRNMLNFSCKESWWKRYNCEENVNNMIWYYEKGILEIDMPFTMEEGMCLNLAKQQSVHIARLSCPDSLHEVFMVYTSNIFTYLIKLPRFECRPPRGRWCFTEVSKRNMKKASRKQWITILYM